MVWVWLDPSCGVMWRDVEFPGACCERDLERKKERDCVVVGCAWCIGVPAPHGMSVRREVGCVWCECGCPPRPAP